MIFKNEKVYKKHRWCVLVKSLYSLRKDNLNVSLLLRGLRHIFYSMLHNILTLTDASLNFIFFAQLLIYNGLLAPFRIHFFLSTTQSHDRWWFGDFLRFLSPWLQCLTTDEYQGGCGGWSARWWMYPVPVLSSQNGSWSPLCSQLSAPIVTSSGSWQIGMALESWRLHWLTK